MHAGRVIRLKTEINVFIGKVNGHWEKKSFTYLTGTNNNVHCCLPVELFVEDGAREEAGKEVVPLTKTKQSKRKQHIRNIIQMWYIFDKWQQPGLLYPRIYILLCDTIIWNLASPLCCVLCGRMGDSYHLHSVSISINHFKLLSI